MSHNIAVIPTRDRVDLCEALVCQLVEQNECDEIFVMDNTDDGFLSMPILSTRPDKVRVVRATGWSIYQMWNWGFQTGHILSQYKSPVNVAILNDDLVLSENFIGTLDKALRLSRDDLWCVYPNYRKDKTHNDPTEKPIVNYSKGTYKHGGMCGWAFMVKAEYMDGHPVPLIDHELFQWWCGDDEIELQIRLTGGKVGRVEGLGLDHVMSASASLHPELHEIGWKDVERFKDKYGADAW